MENNVAHRWLKHYPKEIPQHLSYEEKPLYQYLMDVSSERPMKPAIHFLGKTMTYQQLYEDTVTLANRLVELGLKKGDRVSIMLPNCPQAVISYYAVLMAGGIVVQTNPMYMERELAFQLHDSQSKMIIVLDLLFPKVAKIKKNSSLQRIIVTKLEDYLPFPKNLLYPLTEKKKQPIHVDINYSEEVQSFRFLIKFKTLTPPSVVIEPREDVALLQYTGGTTGLPKGVMLTHHNLVANTMQCQSWVYETEKGKERILAVLPFFHVYGMTVSMNFAIMYQSLIIILPRFEIEEVLKTIEKQKPTLFPGAPTMYISLLNHPSITNYDLSSINACISGSAPLPVEVQEQFEQLTNGRLVEGYGLTEASPVTHANLVWGNRVKGSIGIPWPDTDAKIIKVGRNEEAEVNEIGELLVKGPQVMKGYWGRQEETEMTLQNGWLYTGDLAYMDEEGYFYLVDRKKDMVIAGGYNIYPREIEEVLYEHPLIKEAVVVGIPDPYRGETVKAYLVLKEGVEATIEEFDSYCRKQLAAYKVPHIYEFRTSLPKTMVGKILRRALVEEEKRKFQENNYGNKK